ncbi:MAG: glycosyltransferase family 4 protein [Saprospiraceae bacterium]
MKILQLCKKFPYPPKDGESIAILNLAQSIAAQGVDLDLLAMNTSKHFFAAESTPKSLEFYQSIATVAVDNRIQIKAALLNLFTQKSYHIQRFESSSFRTKLIQLLKEKTYDLILLETLYLTPYIDTIKKYSTAKICLRAHNVEYEIWERITLNTRPGPKKWYLQYLTKQLKRFETAQLHKYDLLAAISKRDLLHYRNLGYRGAAMVLPIGFSIEEYHPNNDSFAKPLTIGFIGSLDWRPNQEGLEWFLREVWPAVHLKFPTLEFHIAGRNTPQRLLNLQAPKVTVHGEVAQAQAFINLHSIALVPLFSGSGMRVKILEAMALGKVVLTTSLGLEGIKAEPQKEVLIADSKQQFLQQISFCYQQNGALGQIGAAARHLVKQNFDRNQQAKDLLNCVEAL